MGGHYLDTPSSERGWMRCEIFNLLALGPRQLAAWRELAATAIVPNPFAEPEVVMPAALRLRAPDAGLLVVENGSGWLAALPVRSLSRWRGVPGRWLTVWRHPYCYLGTPLLAPGCPEATLAHMLRRAVREPGTWAFALEWVDAQGPLAEALAAALPRVGRAPVIIDAFERASLHRRPVPDYLESTLSSRHRKEMRRMRRLLEAEVGVLGVRDHTVDEQGPARFLELERSGWKGRTGTAMACDPDHARLFVDLCRGWERAGRLQLLALQSDERVVSMKCNIHAGAGTFCFKIAFDEELARFSPGVQLEIANIERFHRGKSGWMDSCATPTNSMINRLWEHRRRLQTLVVSPSGSRGGIGHGMWRAARAARNIRLRITKEVA